MTTDDEGQVQEGSSGKTTTFRYREGDYRSDPGSPKEEMIFISNEGYQSLLVIDNNEPTTSDTGAPKDKEGTKSKGFGGKLLEL